MSVAHQELESDLDAFVLGDIDWNDDGDIPPPEDALGASRLLAKLRAFEREIERVTSVTQARVDDMLEWRDRRTRSAFAQIARIVPSLEVWMQHRYDTSKGKVKTETLPDGTLMMRARSRSLEVYDNDAAVHWARMSKRSQLIKVTWELSKSAAREEVTLGPVTAGPGPVEDGYEWRQALVDGEPVPGVVVKEPKANEPKFGYKTVGGTP